MTTAITFEHALIPHIPGEAMTTGHAKKLAGVHEETIRRWCEEKGIGRKVMGRWRVSRVALTMLVETNTRALRLYLAGERHHPEVAAYFERFGLKLRPWA